MQKTQRRITVLCLMSYLRLTFNVYRLTFTVYRLPITDPLSRWFYQSSCCAGFVSVAMVVTVVRDGPRGAWRSLSGDVAKPIARHGGAYRDAKMQKIYFSLSISILCHLTLQNFAELCISSRCQKYLPYLCIVNR